MGMGMGHGRKISMGASEHHQHPKKNIKGSALQQLHSKHGAIGKQKKKKLKNVSVKNQIRSIERLLKKDLPKELRDAQEKRLTALKEEADRHAILELERKMAVRYRKVKFFERRKVERMIRRLEKQQRASADELVPENSEQAQNIKAQLVQLQEDLEYVRFFPKTEKYVSLFMGNENESVVAKRRELREKIKANLAAAAAAGVELEETGSEDDLHLDFSEDEFFLSGKERVDADADDEWTDKSLRIDDKRQKNELPSSGPKHSAKKSNDHRNKTQANLLINQSATGNVHIKKEAKSKGLAFNRKGSSSNVQSNDRFFYSDKGNGRTTSHTQEARFQKRNKSSSGTSSENLNNGKDKPRGQPHMTGTDLQNRKKRKRSRPKKKKK